MNLILCGMMGAGKTTIGVKIAELTGRRWYDTDQMIADRHGKITDIFEYYGEEFFRKIESEILKDFDHQDNLVISTGGGLVLRKENGDILKKNGIIVFLRATMETLVSRLKIDTDRPLLLGHATAMRQKLEQLLVERTPVYEKIADCIVDVDGKTAEENAACVLNALKKYKIIREK